MVYGLPGVRNTPAHTFMVLVCLMSAVVVFHAVHWRCYLVSQWLTSDVLDHKPLSWSVGSHCVPKCGRDQSIPRVPNSCTLLDSRYSIMYTEVSVQY